MIDLSAATLLGCGNERACYLHPAADDRVIKVTRSGVRVRGQNRIDLAYLTALERRGVAFTHLARQYGMVATSLGPGLICERIRDDDGSAAPGLDQAMREGLLARTEVGGLLEELYGWLMAQGVVCADIGLGNLLCPLRGGRRRLVIVDGLGARHPGFKLWLRGRFPSLARRKLAKQWPILQEAWRTSPAAR